MTTDNIFNPELVNIARVSVEKAAFVDPTAAAGGDPSGGMAGGMPADPAMAGAMDPSMAGAMGPSMAGAADPAAMGMGMPPAGGVTMDQVQQAIQQAMGSGGGGGEQIKPKIDVNVEIMQMKKMLAKICDAIGIQIPAADMVATPDDLTQMASSESQGAGPASQASAIPPIQPIQPALPPEAAEPKTAFDANRGRAVSADATATVGTLGDRAAAMARVMRQRG